VRLCTAMQVVLSAYLTVPRLVTSDQSAGVPLAGDCRTNMDHLPVLVVLPTYLCVHGRGSSVDYQTRSTPECRRLGHPCWAKCNHVRRKVRTHGENDKRR
jgi:hypothetical protein